MAFYVGFLRSISTIFVVRLNALPIPSNILASLNGSKCGAYRVVDFDVESVVSINVRGCVDDYADSASPRNATTQCVGKRKNRRTHKIAKIALRSALSILSYGSFMASSKGACRCGARECPSRSTFECRNPRPRRSWRKMGIHI